jgi:hypothetical protein
VVRAAVTACFGEQSSATLVVSRIKRDGTQFSGLQIDQKFLVNSTTVGLKCGFKTVVEKVTGSYGPGNSVFRGGEFKRLRWL